MAFLIGVVIVLIIGSLANQRWKDRAVHLCMDALDTEDPEQRAQIWHELDKCGLHGATLWRWRRAHGKRF